MRTRLLLKLARLHAEHPWRVLAGVLIVTFLAAVSAGGLGLNMRTSDLLPAGDPRVEEFNRIIDNFVSASNLVVLVEGDEEKIKNFANTLAPRLADLANPLREGKPLFQRVVYRWEIDFLRRYGLMLVEEKDMRNARVVFSDPNLPGLLTHINDSLEEEYVGREESISTRKKEDNAVGFLDGVEFMLGTFNQAVSMKPSSARVNETVDRLLMGDPYMMSYDKQALILSVIPNFSLLDRDCIMESVRAARKQVKLTLREFPGVSAGLTGQVAREYDEQVSSEQSLGVTTLIAFGAILVLLIVSFRMWLAPVFAVVNLLMGLLWSMGITRLLVGELNMFTAMMSVVLMGLGVDFSIHLLSGFTEHRAAGNNVVEALENTFIRSGKGVITGAVTTSCAFFTLMISRSRGMQEMGVVTGGGLLTVMVVTFLFMPVMLVLRERFRSRLKSTKHVGRRDISFRFLGGRATAMARRPRLTLALILLASIGLGAAAVRMTWEMDFRKMEPEGLRSIDLMDTIQEKFDLNMEYAMVLADSVEASRRMAEEYRKIPSVAVTDDISTLLPPAKAQELRRIHLDWIAEAMEKSSPDARMSPEGVVILAEQLRRLEMNIMEMQDMAFLAGRDKVDRKCKALVGDPDHPERPGLLSGLRRGIEESQQRFTRNMSSVQARFAPRFRNAVLSMAAVRRITLGDIPRSLLDRYADRERTGFLVTVFPTGNIFDGNFLMRFVDDLERVSEKTTGLPPLSIALIRILGRDGRNAVLLTLLLVFLLLWLDFRNAGHALMAMVPLGLGLVWMVGMMHLAGMKLDIMNLMGLPLIIGIGIDDGVHVIHRWKQEGHGRIFTVFSSTGKAVLLTSLTTMLAFGSMVFSVFRGWISFGAALFFGVGACFITSVTVLPALLGWVEKRRGALKQSDR